MMPTSSYFPRLTAEEAAQSIADGMTVGYSGFTGAACPKATPKAVDLRVREASERGQRTTLRILTAGGSQLGEPPLIPSSDVHADDRNTRRANARIPAVDMQSAALPQMVEFGLFGDLDVAVIEAIDVVRDGRVYLTTASGPSPGFLRRAKRVIIEINRYQSSRLVELHDVTVLPQSAHRLHVPIEEPLDRIGAPYATIDPSKIIGIVETNEPDDVAPFEPADETSEMIADHILRFLLKEMKAGRIPPEFLPLQAGAGSLVNSVLAALGASGQLPAFHMYGDVLQDAALDLMEQGQIRGASATSLTLSSSRLARLFENMDDYSSRLVVRPQDISNNHAVIQRLGIISLNSVLEADLNGLANATRVCGARGRVGTGSGDFVRHAYMSFLITPSLVDGGLISTIVPMVSHVDYSERSRHILVTEQGLADLRGLDRFECAQAIVDNCAHPMYRDYLMDYFETSILGRQPEELSRCFELHRNLATTGAMLPAGVR